MKVKCIATYDKTKNKLVKESNNWLKINKEYIVLEIYCSQNNGSQIRIISEDNETPILADLRQFKTITNKIPVNWEVEIDPFGNVLIGPKNWLQKKWSKIGRYSFWEDFFNECSIALEYFEKETEIIYREEDSLKTKLKLNWDIIRYGINHNLINVNLAIDYAIDLLSNYGSENELDIEIASLTENDLYKIKTLLEAKQQHKKQRSSNDLIRIWIYIYLYWLFDNKEKIKDPLESVKTIYTEFDYPQEIASFIKYQPSINDYKAEDDTREKNEEQLYQLWESYLLSKKNFFFEKD